jgi:hypothetical protein
MVTSTSLILAVSHISEPRCDRAYFVDVLASFLASPKFTRHELSEYVLPAVNLESTAAAQSAQSASIHALELTHALAFRIGLGLGYSLYADSETAMPLATSLQKTSETYTRRPSATQIMWQFLALAFPPSCSPSSSRPPFHLTKHLQRRPPPLWPPHPRQHTMEARRALRPRRHTMEERRALRPRRHTMEERCALHPQWHTMEERRALRLRMAHR